MAVKKHHVKCERGQAIFEMIIFIPLFIFLFTIVYNVGSSINISINQQKAARRYFYYLSKGNSYLPLQFNLEALSGGRLSRVGMAFIGYRQRESAPGSQSSVATCLKFSAFLTGDDGEECEDAVDRSEEQIMTNFVRIYTGYGVCGESYIYEEVPHAHWRPYYATSGSVPDPRSLASACIMAQ